MASDPRPTDKVATAGVTGAAVTVLVGALDVAGIHIDPTLGAAVAVLLAFVAAYFKVETNPVVVAVEKGLTTPVVPPVPPTTPPVI